MEIHDYGLMKIVDNKSNSKIIRYAKFLKNLEIIKINYQNDIYEFSIGETYKSIEKNSKNPVMDAFNYSINMGYEYLYSIGIKSLSPYIKISNSFYHNVINLRKNTEIDIKNLNEYYNDLYHSNMVDYRFNVYIDTLSDAKIIHKKDNVITGDEHITNEMINKNL